MNIPKFQIANYSIPISDIDNAIIAISKFGGNAGGIMANVNRWRKQINLSPLTLKEISEEAIYGKCSLGPYKLFKIINKENPTVAFLCAVISSDSSTVFLKVNITKDGILEIEKEFIDFISTFKFSK